LTLTVGLAVCGLFTLGSLAADMPGGGEPPSVPGGQMPDFDGEMPQFDGQMPDFEGQMPQMPNGEMPQMPGGEVPAADAGEVPAEAADTESAEEQKAADAETNTDTSQKAMTEGVDTRGNMPQPGNFDPTQFDGSSAARGSNETLILLGVSVLVLIVGILIAWKVKH